MNADPQKKTAPEKWIKAELSNNESSSDEELVTYFMQEGPMTKEEATQWVSKRDFFLNNIVMEDGSVYLPPAIPPRQRIK